ncbi:MarR family winged helix-turn-helix transcriptional regulator [Alkalimarinus alittae]|uniref:MarR family transcriptional regulator n=1 Tax=Alkalimarinus alittae TaxID=2961619 RepID=A0ABY6MXS4_9ALTE|nr:MarR family transcriptional regulator [Alkalimarinus alittae]UZE94628.1 MarR family transcriptional regulator [Alkalimarinus alittae]
MNDPIGSKESDALKLENQLCFLLYTASRKMTSAYRPLLTELNLTYPQYLVMLVLWEYFDDVATIRSKQGLKVGVISEKIQLDNGTLTPLLKRLETQGLVTRARDLEDERVVRIGLTQAGIQLKKRAGKIPETMLCNSGLNADQFAEIYAELKVVLKKIPGMVG